MIFDIILDAIIVLVIVFAVIFGIKRGFVKIIAKPIRFFASFAIAFGLANPISKSLVVPLLGAPISGQIKSYLLENCPNITPQTAADELPTLLKIAANILGIDIGALSTESTIDALVDSLAMPIIYLISVILTFILLYFVAKLLLSILISILSSMFEDGLLSLPNKLLGCLFNTLAAIVIVWGFTVIFEFAIHLPMFADNSWVQSFEGGFIYQFFSSLNPVDMLLGF